MNKYTALGLLHAASAGKRILVVSPNGHRADDARREVEAILPERSGATISRANGRQSVRLPTGGDIRFVTPVTQLRGLSADVVLVEDDRDMSHTYVRDLRAVIAASPHGEIIRY